MSNTDSFANDNNVNPNAYFSKSLEGIDLILSDNDSILRGIEDPNDNKEMSSINTDIHDKTLNNLVCEWSICGMSQSNEPSETSKLADHNKEDLNITKRNISSASPNSFDEDNNHWQENTFLNAALTQFNCVSEIKDCLGHPKQKTSTNEFSDNYANLMHLKEENVNQQQLKQTEKQNVKPLKRNLNFYNDIVPHKVHCLNDENINKNSTNRVYTSSLNDNTFYGLPSRVKKLLLQIRGIDTLYEWQDECLNLDAVKKRKNLIYALPTSGGKTLVAEILMLKELICNQRNAIFILPFVAIVQEKVQALAPFALELNFLIEEYAAVKGNYPPKKRRNKKSIYICTIEKALSLTNSLIEENRFHEIGIIVVDELHLLGEKGGRGATLEILLTKALYINESVHIVGMSATIGNLNEIAEFLNADLYTGTFRPVEIKEYVKCDDNIWLVDINVEDVLTDLKKINYRYSKEATMIDPDKIGGLVMDVVPKDSCLIFCSSRKNCENVALLLTRVLFRSLESYKKEEKETLLRVLQTEEGLCPILQKTIKFGVAYHHSGLTAEERRLLEDAFRAGTLSVICCTSTLAAGVNLPARRVILRSPYVGNQFINLSRYKQMIGRAGRAGMGNIGESILICNNNKLQQVKKLLMSKMDDSLSTIHEERDRGINNLILSATLYSIAKTRFDLHQIAKRTLLNIQQTRLNVNIKQIIDGAIIEFLKSGVMKVQKIAKNHVYKPNLSVVIPSQNESNIQINIETKKKKIISLTNDTELEICYLGRAAMKAGINMQSAYALYEDLKKAQEHLILVNYLHLLYLVTPYDIVSQLKPVGSVYYDVVTNLSEENMKTARLLGINEVNVSKLRDGLIPKNIEQRVVNRFYVTLILYDLWTNHAVYKIAEKYQVNRGTIQNLLTAVASFASAAVRFCQELDEFWAFRQLLNSFSKRLSYCCPTELDALMELPLVKIGRARILYNAGYKTLQSVANAKITDLQDKIPYLTNKVATRIIEAAKLRIIEKIEDLKDEAEDILDSVDANNFRGLKLF